MAVAMAQARPSGNLATVQEALRGDLAVGEIIGYGDAHALYAEMSADTPAWYALEVVRGQEQSAAGYLVGRRFGVFLPQIRYEPVIDRAVVRRGDKLAKRRMMFPGYVFIFAWLTDRNLTRLSVPGARRIMCYTTECTAVPVVFADRAINEMRQLEAILDPIEIPPDWKKARKRHGWRRARRESWEEVEAAVKVYEAPLCWLHLGDSQWIEGVEALRVLDACGANQSLARALGLAS